MNRLAVLLFGFVAVALAGILSWELQGDAPVVADIAAPRRPPLPNAGPHRVQEPDHSAEWVAHILARPLFSLTRRPPPPAAAVSQDSPAATLPRLTGVLITPAGGRAIFAGSDGGKPVVVEEGGNLAGFTLRAIAPGVVTVQGPAGETTLHTSFDPTPPPPAAPAGLAAGALPVAPGAAAPPDGGPPAALMAARLQAFRQRQPPLQPQGAQPDQPGTDQPQAAEPNDNPAP